ncbi:AAA family ATPase [Neobacillus jeddahensis]|uniref:AAA family ATPase n=1 Tax=Neobacillus jeddahensis TaxID=1461580 RepID=UPI00058EDB0D|nr:AAA family ATPase [Neobacillus jeddahensis]
MANSKIILATAGSGKTYCIAKHLNVNKKNLVITFTRQNVSNLKNEIIKRHERIPNGTQVITFSSFIYRWLLKPIEPILEVGEKKGIVTSGVEIIKEPPPQRIDGKVNYQYYKKDDYRHYIFNNKYYSSRMAALFTTQPKKVKKLIMERLYKFCDLIYFDELQDFMGEDFKILTSLLKDSKIEVIAVGDFYQHSVSKSNFTTNKPFKKSKEYITKDDYIKLFKGQADIDETLLNKSRRVPSVICDFIRNKLKINIGSVSEVDGHYELLTEKTQIMKILDSSEVVKLFYSNSGKYRCKPVINWGYSKGDTYQKSCIILTKTYENIFDEDFSCDHLTPVQINTLYVAMTRATHELYFIRESDFKKIKMRYL